MILTLRSIQNCSTKGFNKRIKLGVRIAINCENITASLVCKEAKP